MTQIHIPWLKEQVDGLNRWQRAGYVHEFTCPNRSQPDHGATPLLATTAGWICPFCNYTQTWAHDFMFEAPPPNPFEEVTQDPKPCPFCGGTDLEVATVADPGYTSVACLTCFADGPQIDLLNHLNDDTAALAEAAWNERKP